MYFYFRGGFMKFQGGGRYRIDIFGIVSGARLLPINPQVYEERRHYIFITRRLCIYVVACNWVIQAEHQLVSPYLPNVVHEIFTIVPTLYNSPGGPTIVAS